MRFGVDLACFEVNPIIIGYKNRKQNFPYIWRESGSKLQDVEVRVVRAWISKHWSLPWWSVILFVCYTKKNCATTRKKKKKKIVPWSQLKILKHVCLIIQVSRADKWDWATRTTGTGQRVQLGLGQRVQLGLDQRVQLGLGNEYNWDWATSTTVTTSPLIAGLPLSLGYLSLRILASCRLTHTIVGVKNPP